MDLIGETNFPIKLASTLNDLLIKTAQLVSLARQNANLVTVKIRVAQAQAYLLSRSAAIQARRNAASSLAAQAPRLPQIKDQTDAYQQWLLQQYKDKPQTIWLAVKLAKTSRTAGQIADGLPSLNLSGIPGINPQAVAAMNLCNQIALTMMQRQLQMDEIRDSCPKPENPSDDPPPCPAYESAAIQNDSINRSSMTCNKDASGQYIPFFGAATTRNGLPLTLGGTWTLLPDSYYSNFATDPSQLQRNRRQNSGSVTLKAAGPGHFQFFPTTAWPFTLGPGLVVDLYGANDMASGDMTSSISSSGVQATIKVHVEAYLDGGKLHFRQSAVQMINSNSKPIYSEENDIGAPAK